MSFSLPNIPATLSGRSGNCPVGPEIAVNPVSSRAFCIILFTLWKKVCILSVWLYGLKYCVVLINNQMEALLVFKDHGRYYWPGFNGTYQDQWYLHNMFNIRTTQASTFNKESQSKPFATKRTMKLYKNSDF